MSDTPRTDKERYCGDIIGLAGTLEREVAVVGAQLDQCKQMLAARDAEIERLREALREWIAAKDAFDNLDPMDWVSSSAEGDRLLSAEEAIRAVLAQTKEPENGVN